MEIRVAVPDATSAKTLVRRLVGVFDATAVSLDANSREACVAATQESGQTVVRLLDTVEDWLDEADVDAATVRIDSRSYVLARRQIVSRS